MKTRLRIAYLCDQSPLNRTLYSGGNARIYDALCKHAGEVTILPVDWGMAEPLRRLIHKMPEAVNLRARWRMHLALSRVIARKVNRDAAQGGFDVVFGAYAFQCLRHVTVPRGVVTAFTSDATQTIYRTSEIGGAFQSKFWGGRSLDAWVERCEAEVFGNTDLLLWPSQWLHDAAQARYPKPLAASHWVPWGANIDTPPLPRVKTLDPRRPVHLLVVGRDWFAKGGPLAYETMHALRKDGIDAHLTVIGCEPPEFHRDGWVTVHPQLDKSKPDDLEQFTAAFDQAHFLVQPSFESYGFAFCEASAYGLPSLCLRVGGVPVIDGRNGHALPMESDAAAFANMIRRYCDAPDAYHRLSETSRAEYEERLNWDAWGQRTAELLQHAVAAKRDRSALNA